MVSQVVFLWQALLDPLYAIDFSLSFTYTANIIVLSLWTVLSPLHMETQTVDVDNFGRPVKTVSLCNWSDSVPFYSVTASLNFLVLCYALFVAWKAREISTELSESEFIFKAMRVIVLVSFIGIPVVIISRENPAAYFYVCSGIIFVTSSSILLLIFQPKLWAFYRTKYKPCPTKSKVPARFRRGGGGNDSNDFLGMSSSSAHAFGDTSTAMMKNQDSSAEASSSLPGVVVRETGILILKSKRELECELRKREEEIYSLKEEIKKVKLGEKSETAIDLPLVQKVDVSQET